MVVDPLAFGAAFGSLVLLGLGTGALTGLAPGLHVNNVAAVVLATRASWVALVLGPWPSAEPALLGLLLSCYLIATAVSHGIFDFVPSVFLGAPTEETALSILPGHRMLLQGEGPKAVALAARGAVLGTAIAVVLLLPLRWLLGEPVGLAAAFRPWTWLFLVGMLGAMLATEFRGRRRVRRVVRAAIVQLLAGLLGLAVLEGPPVVDPNVVLFPLFSGLFGLPNLVVSLGTRPGEIPEQRTEALEAIGLREAGHAVRGALAGAAVSWLPGLSGGAAATLASLGSGRRPTPAAFMVVLGAVSTSTAILSVTVLFVIGRARSGIAAAVRELLGAPESWPAAGAIPTAVVWLVLASVLAAVVAAPLAARLARTLGPRWSRKDPRLISAATLVGLCALILAASGAAGGAIAAVACLVGLVPIRAGVRRVQMMASLLVPVLVGFLVA